MQQIINLHVGQAGVQMGSSCWELFSHENSINPDATSQANVEDPCRNILFEEVQNHKYIPRTVFVDLQPSVVDEIKVGKYKDLFRTNNMVTGKQDAADTFSRGHYTIRKQIVDLTLDKTRKLVECCDNFQGFILHHSVGGGTGSGLGSLLMERLSVDYGKKPKFCFTIYPSSSMMTSVLQPYNAVLSTHSLLEHSDATILCDNESIYKIMSSKLHIQSPNYKNLNRLIAQNVSSLITSTRYDGTQSASLNSFLSNLIPYPRIHFLQSSYSSLLPIENSYYYNPSVLQITKDVFQYENMMVDSNPNHGKFMSCAMMYRGDCIPKDVISATHETRYNPSIRFSDWVPTGIKVSINEKRITKLPDSDMAKTIRSLCMFSNITSIAEVFSRIDHKFDLMYAKRAFVHWFVGDAMQEGQFSEAREDLAALEKDFEDGSDWYWEGEGEEE